MGWVQHGWVQCVLQGRGDQEGMSKLRTISELRHLAESGESITTVSAQYCIPIQTISSRCKIHGIKFRYYTIRWQSRVEKEFGIPVIDLVRSFFDDGNSKRLTAGAIGIDRSTLDLFCKKNNIKSPSRKELNEKCKPRRRKL